MFMHRYLIRGFSIEFAFDEVLILAVLSAVMEKGGQHVGTCPGHVVVVSFGAQLMANVWQH
jgi:hypothetical protein